MTPVAGLTRGTLAPSGQSMHQAIAKDVLDANCATAAASTALFELLLGNDQRLPSHQRHSAFEYPNRVSHQPACSGLPVRHLLPALGFGPMTVVATGLFAGASSARTSGGMGSGLGLTDSNAFTSTLLLARDFRV